MATPAVSTEKSAPAEDPNAGTVVEFVGEKPYGREFVTVREITAEQFKAIEIEADKDYVFKPENGYRVRVPSGSPTVLEYFENDKGFKVIKP